MSKNQTNLPSISYPTILLDLLVKVGVITG
jgi:hypothetical protein